MISRIINWIKKFFKKEEPQNKPEELTGLGKKWICIKSVYEMNTFIEIQLTLGKIYTSEMVDGMEVIRFSEFITDRHPINSLSDYAMLMGEKVREWFMPLAEYRDQRINEILDL